MNGFIFTQQFNSPDSPLMRRLNNPILCDATQRAPAGTRPTHTCDTGGFHYLADRLRQSLGIRTPVFKYDNRLEERERARSVCDALAAAPMDLDFVAYLGHGTPQGLVSAGIDFTNWGRFKELLLEHCAPHATIVFYACSTGARNGFAEALARHLEAKNVWVWGHAISCNYADLPNFVRYPGGIAWSGRGGPLNFWSEERLHARDLPFEADLIRSLQDNGLL